MKKLANLLLAACMILTLSACADGDVPIQEVVETPVPVETETPAVPTVVETPKPSFEGKIAIITDAGEMAMEMIGSAQMLVEKYSDDKVIHVTWPANFEQEHEQVVKMVSELAANPEVKAIIMHPAVTGITSIIDKLRETRKDIFLICTRPMSFYDPQDITAAIAQRADIVLDLDELGMGPAMVAQAQKLGAKTFVYYYITRRMYQGVYSTQHQLVKDECEKLGIRFIDKAVLDINFVSPTDAEQFIFDDVSKMVAKYGKDTAFFATQCSSQDALVKSIIDAGAIYPQPCHPDVLHGKYIADYSGLMKDVSGVTLKDIIDEEREYLAGKGMLGRISNWPESSLIMYGIASVEYAIKWINGEVPKKGIDVDVLKQLMEEYAGVEVFLTPCKDEYPYTENGTGETYDNFLLMRMDYITF